MDISKSTTSNGNYVTIKEDAEVLLALINKYVKVRLIKETEYHGFVHSIDPIEHSIILLVPKGDSHILNIIPGHAIIDVVEISPMPYFKIPQRKVATLTTSDDIKKQKERLMSWFKRNLLPITNLEDKLLFGKVAILPPYDVSQICTDNPVVAMQLRKIIENMPEDFDPDNS